MANTVLIRSRKHAKTMVPLLGSSLLALGAFSVPMAVCAQEATKTEALPEVKVKASRVTPYKAEQSASTKITQPLLDTPKTIQVVKKEMLREQGATTLMEALRNTPGITMQLGEGGNTSAGDTFQMRGFSTQNSTFVDGIRDLGAVTRDMFNLEQVEIVKGPSGTDIGRGAASGYINLISKQPTLETFRDASLTLGTASKKRVTADLSQPLGEHSAFRLNLMVQNSGVDGRDVVNNKGHGIAPSLAFGLGTPTRLVLSSQHLRQDNVPDGGIPAIGIKGYYRGVTTGTSGANAAQAAAITAGQAVDRSNFYGSKDDFEKVNADMFTAKIEHDLGGGTTVRNVSRYGRTHMDRVLTGVSGINGSNVGDPVSDPALWTVGRSRQRTDQLNEILVNQTSVNSEFEWGGLKHSAAAGVELMYERQRSLGTGTTAQTIRGVSYSAITNPAANLYNPDANDVLGTPYLTGVDTEGKTITAAVYAFDTLTVNEAWKLNAGLRLERYDTSTHSGTIITSTNLAANPGYALGGVAPTSLNDSDNLFSWNLGAVYKPAPDGSIYVAVANSLTPPGGNNFTLSNTSTNQASASMDPQETMTYELGTKWDLLNKNLNVSATLYRTENDKQTSQDPSTGTVSQFGKTRVEGLELAAVGQITSFWQVSAGIAKMKTRQLDQYSRNATTGVVTTTDGVRWSPDLTAQVWTSYTLGAFTVGGGVRHVSESKRVVTEGTDLATQSIPTIPAYTVADLMGAYKVNKNVNLQLNVYNLFDKKYIGVANNNGARLVLGAPRSMALTVNLAF